MNIFLSDMYNINLGEFISFKNRVELTKALPPI